MVARNGIKRAIIGAGLGLLVSTAVPVSAADHAALAADRLAAADKLCPGSRMPAETLKQCNAMMLAACYYAGLSSDLSADVKTQQICSAVHTLADSLPAKVRAEIKQRETSFLASGMGN